MVNAGLIGIREAARIKATVPRAEMTGLRTLFQAIAGIMGMIILLLPVLVLPGLIIIILPAEIYLMDAVYTRIFGTRKVTMSLPLESYARVKRGNMRDFRRLDVARATVYLRFVA